jgi:hypothetical protein
MFSWICNNVNISRKELVSCCSSGLRTILTSSPLREPQISIGQLLTNNCSYYQGYFCDRKCQDAVPEAISQKDASQNLFSWHWYNEVRRILLSYCSSFKQTSLLYTVPEKNYPPFRPNYWLLCVLEPIFFFTNTALVIT